MVSQQVKWCDSKIMYQSEKDKSDIEVTKYIPYVTPKWLSYGVPNFHSLIVIGHVLIGRDKGTLSSPVCFQPKLTKDVHVIYFLDISCCVGGFLGVGGQAGVD